MTEIADKTKQQLKITEKALEDARYDVKALQEQNQFLSNKVTQVNSIVTQLATQTSNSNRAMGAEVIWLRGLLEKILVEPATIKALGQNAIRASEFNERTKRAQEKVNLHRDQKSDPTQETPKQ